MGSSGNAPRPYAQHELRTLFVRVPFGDWPAVKIGHKTEFRARPQESSRVLHVNTPTPVVAYAVNMSGAYDRQLMVMTHRWREPLIAIAESPESLEREGFADYATFRRYWRARHKGVYRAAEMVWVFRLRAWRQGKSGDSLDMGTLLVKRLYGEFM